MEIGGRVQRPRVGGDGLDPDWRHRPRLAEIVRVHYGHAAGGQEPQLARARTHRGMPSFAHGRSCHTVRRVEQPVAKLMPWIRARLNQLVSIDAEDTRGGADPQESQVVLDDGADVGRESGTVGDGNEMVAGQEAETVVSADPERAARVFEDAGDAADREVVGAEAAVQRRHAHPSPGGDPDVSAAIGEQCRDALQEHFGHGVRHRQVAAVPLGQTAVEVAQPQRSARRRPCPSPDGSRRRAESGPARTAHARSGRRHARSRPTGRRPRRPAAPSPPIRAARQPARIRAGPRSRTA